MLSRFFIGLVFCFSPLPLIAQVVIEGKFSTPGNLISGINVVIYPRADIESIIAYGFSDVNGEFRISVKHHGDSITLIAKSMHYADTLLYLANRSQKLIIPLAEKSYELDEVRVEGRPIYRHGDTTSYSVNAFAQKQNFSIGDVIRNMPGFDVDDNGKISYQGQRIQKYYIEGMDLLEGRYALANNNLPHASVSTVEVLHNHQPIKAVEGVVSSSSTSLNIKLSKSVTATGRGQVGAGGTPLLWDMNLTPMLFAKKQQVIGSLQANNTGRDIGIQHQSVIFRDGKLDGIATLKSDLVDIPAISPPVVGKNKYLDNQTNLLTYNHLFKLSPKTELKLNASYYCDNIDEEGRIATTYFLQDSILNIYEHQKNTFLRNSLIANLSLTQNVKARYLLNKLSFGRFWDANKANISNTTPQYLKAELPHTTVANTFDVLIPLRKNFLRVESMVDYNDSPQQLILTPGAFITSSSLSQQFSNRSFITANKLGFSLPVKSFLFSTLVEVDYEHQKYSTAVIADGVLANEDSLSNSLKWDKTDIVVKEEVEFKKGGLVLRATLPLQYSMLSVIDDIHDADSRLNKPFFKPSLYMRYRPTGSLTGNIHVAYNKSLGSMKNLLIGNVITSHRLMKSSQTEVDIVQMASMRAGITYHNPVSGFFADISLSTTNTEKGLMLNQTHQGNGVFIYKYEQRKGDAKASGLSSEVSWYIRSIKTTIGAKGEYLQSSMDYLMGGQPNLMEQQLLAVTPKLLFGLSKYFSATYSYRIAETKTEVSFSTTKIVDQKHKLELYIYAANNHLIGFENELYYSKKTGLSSNQSLFSNIVYTYKPLKGRFDFKLECRNLFNVSKLVEIRQSDIILLNTEYYIRPRQFLLTVNWSIGRR